MEVMIISASNLKNVKHISKMRPYAEVYVEKDVHVDDHGVTDPTWNDILTVKFHEGLPERDVKAALNIDIYARGRVRDKPVGSARVLLCDVLKGGDPTEPADNPIQCTTIRVWTDSGEAHGLLHLWVPPTGQFLMRRESLSFSIREEATTADDGHGVSVDTGGKGNDCVCVHVKLDRWLWYTLHVCANKTNGN